MPEPWMLVPQIAAVAPLSPWTMVWRVRFASDNSVVQCTTEWRTATAKPVTEPCKSDAPISPARLTRLRGNSTGPFDVLFFVEQGVDGMPMPALVPRPSGWVNLPFATATFFVDGQGRSSDCQNLNRADTLCGWERLFKPDPAGAIHSAKITVGYYTNGGVAFVPPPPPVMIAPRPASKPQ